MSREQLIALLRAEAAEACASSTGNGDYNTPFYVASIVLESLACRLEALTEKDPS